MHVQGQAEGVAEDEDGDKDYKYCRMLPVLILNTSLPDGEKV